MHKWDTKKAVMHVYYTIGNHTFAILSGNENYMILKEGFAPVLVEINDLINRPVLKLNDKIVDLSIILGGDYKVF